LEAGKLQPRRLDSGRLRAGWLDPGWLGAGWLDSGWLRPRRLEPRRLRARRMRARRLGSGRTMRPGQMVGQRDVFHSSALDRGRCARWPQRCQQQRRFAQVRPAAIHPVLAISA
jgi:hypothetical protein